MGAACAGGSTRLDAVSALHLYHSSLVCSIAFHVVTRQTTKQVAAQWDDATFNE